MTREEQVFWTVLTTLVVVIIVAGLAVAWRHGGEAALTTYLPDESTPEKVVYNAYVAARRQDMDRLRGYFRQLPWKTREGQQVEIVRLHVDVPEGGEIRVGEAEISNGRAKVPVQLIRQWSAGIFGTEISVQEEVITLEREGDRWLITGDLPFVYPVFKEVFLPAPPVSGGD